MKRVFGFLMGAVFGAVLIGGLFLAVTTDWDAVRDQTAARAAPETDSAPNTVETAVDTARNRARETLAAFDRLAATPGADLVALQVEVPAARGGVENLWMTACTRGGPADYVCTVTGDPSRPEINAGDAYAVVAGDVVDWRIDDESGRIHGAFALRAQLPTMAAEARSALIARLAPLPRP